MGSSRAVKTHLRVLVIRWRPQPTRQRTELVGLHRSAKSEGNRAQTHHKYVPLKQVNEIYARARASCRDLCTPSYGHTLTDRSRARARVRSQLIMMIMTIVGPRHQRARSKPFSSNARARDTNHARWLLNLRARRIAKKR